MSIEARNISKTFGSFTALSNVNLRVDDGELVALLGPSGSGKTTLLRIIAGLETPDPNPNSQILFHDQQVTNSPVGQRRVGFVFQHYALFRHLSVFENVAFGLRVRPKHERPSNSEISDRVHNLLKLIQLDGFGNRFPSQLSGGQRQRVALARALAVEPKVLLLDEPFGALDAKVRKDLRDWLRKLHDEIHLTSVLVTHDQDEALEVADRVVVMNQARIEQTGTPAEVFHKPATEFVMQFLGQVNVFRGRVSGGKAHADGMAIDYPAYPHQEARQATIYLRPHELEIRNYSNGVPSIPARVLRINPAGAATKVTLQTTDGQELLVDLSQDRYRELNLATNDQVFVYAKQARVFVPDYSI